MVVLEAEQQLGWVIHRLGRHTSHSFRREAGYWKAVNKLHACASLLPGAPKEEVQWEIPAKGFNRAPSSVSAL